MEKAFPADEINPISCKPQHRDYANFNNYHVNDVLGNFSLTLVDSLDTFAIMNDKPAFEKAVELVIKHVHFDKNSRVQVFETNIRMLGSLLSSHSLASSNEFGFKLSWYNNELLHLAQDLGDRLLKAFSSSSGVPFPRIDLRDGVLPDEAKATCTAGAGTLLIEFAVLSRLSNDPRYENAAKRALKNIWKIRSKLGLLGNTFDIEKMAWIVEDAGIGAGIDSFYEYLFKSYILLGEEEYLIMFKEAYQGVLKHIRDPSGFIYKTMYPPFYIYEK
jgi:mannosidase alpha-like ER degradation enhancer 1